MSELFGIEFDDHPDPRRLLLPEAYPGYPLRKDEPTGGSAGRASFLEAQPRATEPTRKSGGGDFKKLSASVGQN